MVLPIQVKTNQSSVLPTVAVDHVISHDPATIGRATDCRRQKKKKKKKKKLLCFRHLLERYCFLLLLLYGVY